ncbi:MAG: tyrosine-type recombinase/integrase [Acidobacteriia bacterium]|nr:tyrosine-type recombinase/integrase [Terriglobia bacterium]MYG04897.1 tyrosine-type recombinase/integrase [Terriglobia bacterium]MYK09023.1 tyrosine-type recombinase/integrase [Terriglobia bacterium]
MKVVTEGITSQGTRTPKRLSSTFVKTVTRPGRYGDGRGSHGLSLLVKPMKLGGHSRTWSQRLRINGKPTSIGLGPYPIVTLAEARQTALENRRAVARGHDPRNSIPTLAEASERVLAIHSTNWKHSGRSEKIWRARMRAYVMPQLGRKRVDHITTADVMSVLLPHWSAKRETMSRIKQRLSRIFRWSIAQGYRTDDPAGTALDAALPRNGGKAQHYAALPHGEVAAAIAAVRKSGAWPGTKAAFEFLVLTACRSGDVRLAKWGEVNLKSGVWTIPADRAKTQREHRVPLAPQAIAILDEMRKLTGGEGLIFPSVTGKALSDSTLSKLVREQGVRAVPHGFRSSFRDWCGETGQPREVAEACLAHAVKNKVEAAYARSDLLNRRRKMMRAWAEYLTATGQARPAS